MCGFWLGLEHDDCDDRKTRDVDGGADVCRLKVAAMKSMRKLREKAPGNNLYSWHVLRAGRLTPSLRRTYGAAEPTRVTVLLVVEAMVVGILMLDIHDAWKDRGRVKWTMVRRESIGKGENE